MPGRLIGFLVVLTVVVLFAGFNITNVSDISFGFYTLTKVPVFLSLFIAFLVGTFVMLPFAFRKRNTKVRPEKSRKMKQNADNQPVPEMPLKTQPVPESAPEPEVPKKRRAKK